ARTSIQTEKPVRIGVPADCQQSDPLDNTDRAGCGAGTAEYQRRLFGRLGFAGLYFRRIGRLVADHHGIGPTSTPQARGFYGRQDRQNRGSCDYGFRPGAAAVVTFPAGSSAFTGRACLRVSTFGPSVTSLRKTVSSLREVTLSISATY